MSFGVVEAARSSRVTQTKQSRKRTVFGFVFCIFGAKSSVFPPLSHHPKFRNFFDHMFDHNWIKGKSFGCFCFGTLCSRKTKFKRFPEVFPREPFSLFPAYQFLVTPYNDLPADLVALLADSFQFQNHFSQEFFFA